MKMRIFPETTVLRPWGMQKVSMLEHRSSSIGLGCRTLARCDYGVEVAASGCCTLQKIRPALKQSMKSSASSHFTR